MAGLSALIGYIWRHPGNRGRRGAALARAAVWQVFKRVTGSSRDLRLWGGMRLRCYPDSTCASSALYSGGLPEFDEMRFLMHYLRRGDGFLDVGANIGLYTLLASALVGTDGSVDAFEPSRREAARLRENLGLNSLVQVRVHEVAVTDREGPVRLAAGRDPTIGLDQTWHLRTGEDAEGESFEVPGIRLDDAVAGRRYALGKVDIEGAEPLALAGAVSMLEDFNPPVWLVELNGLLRGYGYSEVGLCDWMLARGFESTLYDSHTRRLRLEKEPWRSRPNVLFVAKSHREQVEERLRASDANSG